jgi:hypothetical protein
MTASSFVASREIDSSCVLTDFDKLDNQLDRNRRFSTEHHEIDLKLIPKARTFRDLLMGVQHFDFGMYEITACRGKIALYGPYCDFGFGKVRR